MTAAALDPLDGLRCPPFGLGAQRAVTNRLTGHTSDGIPYQGFHYETSEFHEYGGVVTMRLGLCLPAFFVSLPTNPRDGIRGVTVPNNAGILTVGESEELVRAVLAGSLLPICEFARRRPLDLAIDGSSLTATHVPLTPEALSEYCEDLAIVARSLSADPGLRAFQVPPERGQGWYGYPGSLYVERDDALLTGAPVAQHGTDHSAQTVVALAPDRGLQAIGFTHRYVVVSSDGHTTTSQVHQDPLVKVTLPFRFGPIGMDWRGFGDPLMLFVPSFEEHHQIWSTDNAFATTVARPMVDWLTDMAPPAFAVTGSAMWFSLRQPARPAVVAWCADFAEQFFSRVPAPVWQRLGYPANPLALDLR